MWQQQKLYWQSNIAQGIRLVPLENMVMLYISISAKGIDIYAIMVVDHQVPGVRPGSKAYGRAYYADQV